MKNGLAILILVTLAACGGGGGDADGSGGYSGGLTNFDLSGLVVSSITGQPIAGVAMSVTGQESANTTTDGTGSYSFRLLHNGSYTVTATLAGTTFSPTSAAVTIDGADVANENFDGVRLQPVIGGVEFMPQTFSSADQLRASLHIDNGNVIYTDSSDAPLKSQPLDGSPATALAQRFTTAEGMTRHNGVTYWIEGGDLHKTDAAGITTILAVGLRAPGADVSTEPLVDDNYVYWVDEAPVQTCSPACNWDIHRIPLNGGPADILASVDHPINDLALDANSLYWLELGFEPVSSGCACGTRIKSIPKSGGAITVLVDGLLNGLIPVPALPSVAGSWMPSGGMVLDGAEILFASSSNNEYDILAVAKTGGAIRNVVNVTPAKSSARSSIYDITIDGANAYWIDDGNSTLLSVPVAGGTTTTVASNLVNPTAMTVAGGNVIWADAGVFAGCCLQLDGGSILQVATTGGAVTTIIDGLAAPFGLAADNSSLFWSEEWRIGSSALDGSSVSTTVSGIGSDLARIAVSQSTIYILDGGLIKMMPVAGGPIELLASARFGQLDDISVRDVGITADDSNVYWTVRGVGSGPVVQKAPIAGGDPVTLAGGAAFQPPQDCYWRIAVDPIHVYWSESSNSGSIGCVVKKVPIVGGAVTTVVDQDLMTDFTVGPSDVYFATLDGVFKTPLDGGAITTVASTGIAPWVLANNTNRVYWADLQVEGVAGIAKAAGTAATNWFALPAQVISDPLLAWEAVTADDSGVYFTELLSGTIYAAY